MSESKRKMGAEFRAALWLARHPGSVIVPGALAAGTVELGATATGAGLGGAALALGCWYRAHPDSFDQFAGPRIRAWYARWWRYVGHRWRDVLLSCDLYATHRKTGELRIPRILRVNSPTPTIDTIHVRMVPGQHVKQYEAKLGELADALNVERVGVERVKPQVIALVLQRREPFTDIIDAPEMPFDSDAVDLGSLFLGETEYGGDWRGAILGQHWFTAGATGAGKNSIGWSMLRGLAPLLRDGLCRLWLCDPKRMEFAKAADITHRYAAEPDDCRDLVTEYVEDMRATQRHLSAEGKRKVRISRETPLNLLVLDEMAALTAFGDHARAMRALLTEMGTQGRATGHSMVGFVQEPTKDTVPMRDLFTTRVCLRTTSAAHVDMVLGENARLRGALADEIPNVPETAGIGFVIRQRSRAPMRVRAAYVTDNEIDELVTFVKAGMGLRAVA